MTVNMNELMNKMNEINRHSLHTHTLRSLRLKVAGSHDVHAQQVQQPRAEWRADCGVKQSSYR